MGAPDEPISLFIRLDEADLEALYERDLFSDDRLSGSYRFAPDEEYRALREPSLRFRGASSRRAPKKSFNIRFDETVPAFGVDRINLNAMYTDPSQLREDVAFWMFHELGQPAPRTAFVDLYLQDGFEGLYLFVQRVDRDLLREHGVTTSALVRDRSRRVDSGPWSVFGYGSSDLSDDLPIWLEERFDSRGDADWDALAELVQWAVATPAGEEFDDGLEERFDLDNLVDWIAIHELIADVDSYGDDYWLYLETSGPQDRWSIVPWDMDLSFGSHYIAGGLGGTRQHAFRYEWPLVSRDRPWVQDNGLVEKAMRSPRTAQRVEDRLLELLAGRLEPSVVEARIRARADLVEPSATREPDDDSFRIHPGNHHGETSEYDLHVDALIDFLELRDAFLRRHLADEEGDRDRAELEVSSQAPEGRLLLTDPAGWTIAALELPMDADVGNLTVEVEESQLSDAVDRLWRLSNDGQGTRAEVSVYYRNVPDNCGLPVCENWYRPDEDLTFVGGQRNLAIAVVGDDGELEVLPSSVNPYSNRVTASVDLASTTELVLVERPAER